MAYKNEIEILVRDLAELKEIKDRILQLEQQVMSIEKEICTIDECLPSDDQIELMKHDSAKEEVLKALSLTKEAYDLVDDILGPPEPMSEQAISSSAILPQARGNDESISLEAAIRKFNSGTFNPGGKNTAS